MLAEKLKTMSSRWVYVEILRDLWFLCFVGRIHSKLLISDDIMKDVE